MLFRSESPLRGLVESVVPRGTFAELGRGLLVNTVDLERATQIAEAVPKARVADRQSIEGMARLVAGAEFIVGGDTGLVHLAAAFGVPLVAIFSGTDPALTRPIGSGPMEVVGTKGTTPSVEAVAGALNEILH